MPNDVRNGYAIDEQRQDVSAHRPHVVVLGAGASLQAFPNGDKHGKRLPLMNNIIYILELGNILKSYGVEYRNENLEVIYDEFSFQPRMNDLKEILERKIFTYFSSLEIPDEPTIYDYLVLSLRSMDIIATFNWDPFLVQAYQRNGKVADLSELAFLHGNVEIGWCKDDMIKMMWVDNCPKCGNELIPTRLLYPVSEKDYSADPFIKGEWELLQYGLRNAFLLTIFGYSAPTSDVKAMELFIRSWGSPEYRQFEEIEIIDIKNSDELHETWKGLIHSYHWSGKSSFYDSMLIKHPRRSVEAYFQLLLMARPRQENRPPITDSWEEIRSWYKELSKYKTIEEKD